MEMKQIIKNQTAKDLQVGSKFTKDGITWTVTRIRDYYCKNGSNRIAVDCVGSYKGNNQMYKIMYGDKIHEGFYDFKSSSKVK